MVKPIVKSRLFSSLVDKTTSLIACHSLFTRYKTTLFYGNSYFKLSNSYTTFFVVSFQVNRNYTVKNKLDKTK